MCAFVRAVHAVFCAFLRFKAAQKHPTAHHFNFLTSATTLLCGCLFYAREETRQTSTMTGGAALLLLPLETGRVNDCCKADRKETLSNRSTPEALCHLGDAGDNEPSLYNTQVSISSLG